MSFKAVIFDLDGTLVNSIEDIASSMNVVLKKNEFPTHDLETYERFIGYGIRNLVFKAVPETHKEDEFVDIYFKEMLQVYRDNCVQKTALYSGVPEMLNALVSLNIPMAVFSNKAEELTKKVVQYVVSEWKFTDVVGLTTEVLKKPNPNKAIQIAESLGISTREILFVGDSEVDMQTAIGAGMQAVGVVWGFRSQEQLEKSGATYILQQPLDLIDIIKKQN
ncbi:HAD family hydrolase [Wenyingzhuangia sp. 2_MG-2023]|uniref:HAD family hydrolase n=1 Tax=Wenyingzhuangia sp. 2_MG-2023 TaxID=3062639 RepID=UPI0026E3A151|nr:HAD family hydrolase [Wenyingzhuangia sp. 2_MG-2023]MDO6737485.1 HAD family hydrolase [Wenyingzhuangia sp. 2_MG-2023]